MYLSEVTGHRQIPRPPSTSLYRGGASGERVPGFTQSEAKALRITSTFETGRPLGFGGLTGNFDRQGLSFGLLQWNFGTGSLQPLLQEFDRDHPDRFKMIFGPDAGQLRTALRFTRTEEERLRFPHSINDSRNRIVEPWKSYFGRLEQDPEFQKIQIKHARKRMDRAIGYARQFGFKSERGLALMFDLVTQLGPAWLTCSRPACKKRALLIEQRRAAFPQERGRPPTEQELIAIIANVAADTSLPQFREKVRARKMTIVNGFGQVHRHNFDLAREFGLGDQPWEGAVGAVPPVPAPVTTQPSSRSTGDILQRIQEAVSRGQWYLALGMAVTTGVRDQDRLTDLIFYARHPERKGRRLAAGDPQNASLSREWLEIRNRLVRPFLEQRRSGGRAPIASPLPVAGSVSPSSAPPVVRGDSADKAAFLERVLSAHIARSTKNKGAALPDLRDDQLAPVQGTSVSMRADAAAVAGRLIAAANQALAAASAAGHPDARRTRRISATSGYRGRAHQDRLWRGYFDNFYQKTAAVRAKLAGGPHGEAAVKYMVSYVSPKIAAPGFSNHQAGVAIDFKQERTPGNEIYNSTDPDRVEKWHNTWFFEWLGNNASRFRFHPYDVEPWHWEYRP